jgi:hypothetical protein
VRRFGPGLYDAQAIDKEATMHGIIESLCPEDRHIDWKWVGSMFVFYVVTTIAVAGAVVVH